MKKVITYVLAGLFVCLTSLFASDADTFQSDFGKYRRSAAIVAQYLTDNPGSDPLAVFEGTDYDRDTTARNIVTTRLSLDMIAFKNMSPICNGAISTQMPSDLLASSIKDKEGVSCAQHGFVGEKSVNGRKQYINDNERNMECSRSDWEEDEEEKEDCTDTLKKKIKRLYKFWKKYEDFLTIKLELPESS